LIPLKYSCDIEGGPSDGFVARILDTRDEDDNLPEHTARLVANEGERYVYQYRETNFSILSDVGPFFGDVVFIDPIRKSFYRWIRADSADNTLLVTERCDQLCIMCSQPPQKYHIDRFDFFKTACLLSPPDIQIGISGGEPTLFKDRLFELLLLCADQRPDLRFHILTNAQHFSNVDVENLQKLNNSLWGVPIYSSDSEVHEKIVGKKGAFARLLNGLCLLGISGSNIELRTVVMNSNVQDLESIARLISNKISFADIWAIMQLENIGFARKNWQDIFFDHSIQFEPIAAALRLAQLNATKVGLYNFPLCTVPSEWRSYTFDSISDWKKKFVDLCDECSQTATCSGLFEWHSEERNYKGLQPI
jgi:His-Xaa-Ser system radical SAM maturase HxsC